MCKRILILLLGLSMPNQSPAQNHSSIHYTTLDGLPSQVVYDILQDSRGFMWMGTQNGLCRFDGKNFKIYTTDDGLPDNEVLQLAEDKQGRLWLSVFNSGPCYYKDGKFFTTENDSLLRKVEGIRDFVSYYFPGNGEGFWIYSGITSHKLYYLDYSLQIKARYEGVTVGRVNRSEEDKTFTMITNEGVTRFLNGRVNKLAGTGFLSRSYHLYSSSAPFVNRVFYTSLYGKKNLLIIILDENFKTSREIVKPFPYRLQSIYRVAGYYYIITEERTILRCSAKDTLLNNYEVFMKGDVYNAVTGDSEGGLWITTFGNGVYYIPSKNASTFSVQSGLYDNSIYSIFEHNNSIGFSDAKGNVYALNPTRKIFSISDGTKLRRIFKAVIINRDELVVATEYGIYKLNAKAPWKAVKISYGAKDVEYKDGRIYLATVGVLSSYNITSPGMIDTISISRKTCLRFDKNNNLWYGSLNGLYRWNKKQGEIDYAKKYPELKSRIAGIAIGGDSMVWVATQKYGLAGLKNDSLFFRISVRDGLATNNLKGVFAGNGKVYIATDKGVDIVAYSLPDTSYTIRHLDKFDGLADNDVLSVLEKNDTLYAGTAHGLSVIPLKNEFKKVSPKIYITGFSADGVEYPTSQALSLPHYKNNITLSFVGLSFRSGSNISYRYKIGEDGAWKYTRNTNLTFPDLAPGKYHVSVDAQTSYGEWSTVPAVIDFTIQKPFWKESWFLVLIFFGVALLILYAWYSNLRKAKHDLQLRNSMLRSEIKALRAQMNPHFIFNSLNSIQHFIFSNRKEEANEYLHRFSKLIRLILDNSQNNFISVADEVDFLTLYLELERFRLNDKFDVEFIYDLDSNLPDLLVPSMFFQPFIENSIVHGMALKQGRGKLTISFKLEKEYLQCTIEDDGPGMPVDNVSNDATKTHRSFSMSALRDRASTLNQLYNTDISFELINLQDRDKDAKGTCVFIRLRASTGIAWGNL